MTVGISQGHSDRSISAIRRNQFMKTLGGTCVIQEVLDICLDSFISQIFMFFRGLASWKWED